MQSFRIEVVRGWRIVTAPGGRIVGVHPTDAKAHAQIAAISRKRNAPKEARCSRA